MKKLKLFALTALALIISLVGVGCFSGSYRLSVEASYDYLIEKLDGYYEAGEKVTVKTVILTDTELIAYLDGVALESAMPIETNGEYTHWEFYFEMPDHDATLTFEARDGFLP